MDPEMIFMTACLVFSGLLMAWLSMLGRLRARALLGVSGALVSALVMGAFCLAEHVEWVGVLLKPLLGVWLLAGVLCGFAVVSGSKEGHGDQRRNGVVARKVE